MGTAVSCDLRIASDDSRFGVPAAKLGVGYRYARLKQLEALVGPSFTMEIFYTGRQFTAQEALTMGLINRMVEGTNLLRTMRRSYYGVPTRPDSNWLNDRQIDASIVIRL